MRAFSSLTRNYIAHKYNEGINFVNSQGKKTGKQGVFYEIILNIRGFC